MKQPVREIDQPGQGSGPNTTATASSSGAIRRLTLGLILMVGVAKLVYLIWLCPYDLIGDEAHYWEWSRRLGLSYYTKGPGIAWTIAAATAVLGHAEWAIRLPAVLASTLTALCLARLADQMGQQPKAGLYAAAGFLLIPGFAATSLIMTIDGPYLACWAVAAWAGWRVADGMREGHSPLGAWVALAAALAVGFLYKYTILLLALGLIGFWWQTRRELAWRRAAWGHLGLAVVVFLMGISPVIVWNVQHGWPTVAHLLGHLGAPGGDTAPKSGPAWNPIWPLEFFGSQVGFVGPLLLPMALAVWRFWRPQVDRDPPAWHQPRGSLAAKLMLWAGLPVILFYVAVSFVTDAEGNWPIAGYLTLLVLSGQLLAQEMPHFRDLVARWQPQPTPRPRWGLFRRKPETPTQVAWHWQIGFGLIAIAVLVAMPAVVWLVPAIEPLTPLSRLTAHAAYAERVAAAREAASERLGEKPQIIVDYYDEASLLGYYLPGRPSVACAMHVAGGRKSAYDYFADTDLSDPDRVGRPALLVGRHPGWWQRVLSVSEPKPMPQAEDVYLSERYRGLPEREAER